MMPNSEDYIHFEDLRDKLVYAAENVKAAKEKVIEAHKDYELADKAYQSAYRAYVDFKPVVEESNA